MKITLDVENTVTKRDGKMHLDPFEPDNTLVMVGMLTDQGQCLTFPFDHADRPNQDDYYERVQMMLDEATVLICHNAAHDLLWLWESGFKYDGPVYDTMLAEYVLQRGQKEPEVVERPVQGLDLANAVISLQVFHLTRFPKAAMESLHARWTDTGGENCRPPRSHSGRGTAPGPLARTRPMGRTG